MQTYKKDKLGQIVIKPLCPSLFNKFFPILTYNILKSPVFIYIGTARGNL